jgi:hypothetical protein
VHGDVQGSSLWIDAQGSITSIHTISKVVSKANDKQIRVVSIGNVSVVRVSNCCFTSSEQRYIMTEQVVF